MKVVDLNRCYGLVPILGLGESSEASGHIMLQRPFLEREVSAATQVTLAHDKTP